jgi:hypothetical protein
VPPAETLICFSSKRIEIHPCPQCRYPMTKIADNSSHSNSGVRSFHCFNCGGAGRSSLSARARRIRLRYERDFSGER